MEQNRIIKHPIIENVQKDKISFSWNGKQLWANENETISAALIANQIHTFSHHHKNKAPQGIYCANGQCAQCMVLCNEKPVKACMTKIKPNMELATLKGLPKLLDGNPKATKIINKEVEVLIVGGGPAGISAARELTSHGVKVLLVDDKSELGGKLTLQTHRFFGSVQDVYAGQRGTQIGKLLEQEAVENPNIEIWLESPCVAVFSDHKIGIIKNQKEYALITTKAVLFTTGAREKTLKFPGNSLPGIYGAGAFQTLVNKDQVIPSKNLLIIGGGNVGLIAGYHALQADINVSALVEAMPICGGYKVHHDKLKRLGVPIYTSHTVIEAYGKDHVEKIKIAQIDEKFNILEGTEKIIECDTVLIAVGLSPVNELTIKAKEFGFNVFEAGDCNEIAEASAAIFSGKLVSIDILNSLGRISKLDKKEIEEKFTILKSRPGELIEEIFPNKREGVYPIFHCLQEIPCNPCSQVCPFDLIKINPLDIRKQPTIENIEQCIGCGKCLVNCSGLAISLVDYRKSKSFARVTLPCEFTKDQIGNEELFLVDITGNELGKYKPILIKDLKNNNHTRMIIFDVEFDIAEKVIGFRLPQYNKLPEEQIITTSEETVKETMICRCEQVSDQQVRELIRNGIHDFNQLKAITRIGMGACQGKTCTSLVMQIMREEGVEPTEITPPVERPLFMDIPLQRFLNDEEE